MIDEQINEIVQINETIRNSYLNAIERTDADREYRQTQRKIAHWLEELVRFKENEHCQKAEVERLQKESDEWARRFINRCRDYEFEIQQNEKLKAENEKKNTEIDILIEKKDTLQDENSELKAEIERLKNENFGLGTERDAAMECMDTAVIEAKSEAIREFVKKFEKKIKDVKFTLGQTWEIQNALKDTLNEMVGDDNG